MNQYQDLIMNGELTEIVKKPWGSYQVLMDSNSFKVKHLIVNPKEKLSLQSHELRSEHWIITEGEATITLGDATFFLKKDDQIYIPKKTKHCVENQGKTTLEFIEVQNGSYLGEDDIVRYEDIYGRV